MVVNKEVILIVAFVSLSSFLITSDFCFAQQPAPTIINYTYDSSGQRITMSNGATTTVYPTKNYNVESNTQNLPPKVTKHIFANGQDLATIQGSGATTKIYYNAADSLNSSSVMTDSAGVIAETMDYFPFGAIRLDKKTGTSTFSEQRKYIGQEYDADTNLNYLNARYYNATLARFISQDPVYLAIGDNNQIKQITGKDQQTLLADPQQLNAYSYAGNNPIVKSDPTGNNLVGLVLALLFLDPMVESPYTDINPTSQQIASAKKTELGFFALSMVIPGGAEEKGAGKIFNFGEGKWAEKTLQEFKAGKMSALEKLPDSALVCRSGSCSAEAFESGTRVIKGIDGKLSGVSVNIQMAQESKEALLNMGPQKGVGGFSTTGDLRKAGVNFSPESKRFNHFNLGNLTKEQFSKLFTEIKK